MSNSHIYSGKHCIMENSMESFIKFLNFYKIIYLHLIEIAEKYRFIEINNIGPPLPLDRSDDRLSRLSGEML